MTATPRIRVMPPDLALKIAAGEVVERPSSAVKELIDNAIDAGATSIRIEVREAGLRLIRVTDDGCGIRRSDLPLAFTSHATSKIAVLDDLEHLSTLGFRGEALPSIAAIARVDVRTSTLGESEGSRFEIEFGSMGEPTAAGAPRGTRMTVQDIFANVPARRKFVRSQRAEGGQITAVVSHYALAQPEVRFSLDMDGRTVFESPGTGRVEDAVAAVYGPAVVESLLAVHLEESGIRVTGLTSRPSLNRQNRSAIQVFANGRPIANRSLTFALEEAYSGFLMTGRHPLSIIYLQVPPGEVDANIHPAKAEVRFAREREIHGVLHRAITDALLEMRLETRAVGAFGEREDPGEPATEMPLAMPEETSESVPQLPMPETPALRVFGQSNRTFIIAEGPNGLYMIDQHAAHERILFDRLESELHEGKIASQPLLAPLSIELTPSQMSALDANRDLLARAGFQLEPFGTDTCLVRAVPAVALKSSPVELVSELLKDLETVPRASSAPEQTLATTACKAAVKAGQALDLQEMRELVVQLERTARPSTCPHGRPTMIHLSHSQLEREFGRR